MAGVKDHMSAEMRGYILELQAQISLLSDRAAGLSGALVLERQKSEELSAQIAALKKKSAGKDPENQGDNGEAAT